MSSDPILMVLVTCGSQAEALALAEAVVEERLAACVNIVPGLTSVYRWEGAVQKDSELLLLIKTTQARLAGLQERVRQLHSYNMPEFVALPIQDGSTDYLDWLRASVRP